MYDRFLRPSPTKSMALTHTARISFAPRQIARCLSSQAQRNTISPAFGHGPAPPRLPKEDQELYEKLQKSSTGAFSTPTPSVVVNQSSTAAAHQKSKSGPQINQSPATQSDIMASEQKIENLNAKVTARGDGEELHPDIRRGTRPEFEGDRNPKTGETGGPKNEPLRWGGGVDWSYNGRVTDF